MRTYRQAELPPQPKTEWVTDYACDKCGKKLTREWPESEESGSYAHELIITLDREDCCSFFRQRDYCPECLGAIWFAINDLLGADPNAERDRDYG